MYNCELGHFTRDFSPYVLDPLAKKYFSSALKYGAIYGDYRTGQIAVRGKNNGKWQAWRRILDSSNYTSYCTSANIGAAASSHTHKYAGSSSAGGSATSAVKLDFSAGSATQPTVVIIMLYVVL